MFYHKNGGDFDKPGRTISTDGTFGIIIPFAQTSTRAFHNTDSIAKVLPLDSKSVESARGMHIDYSLMGLRDTLRNCQVDFSEAGAAHLAALDSASDASDASDGNAINAPRDAAYSVWRPLKRVNRDSTAVLDYQTAWFFRWHAFDYRSTGFRGDCLLEAYSADAPGRQRRRSRSGNM